MAEENINNILGIEDSSTDSINSSVQEESGNSIDNVAENTLTTIAGIVLWVGIIGTIFCLFTLTTTKVVDPTYTYSIHYDTIFNPAGLAISIGVLLSTITTWALLKVIANISKTLKEINSKMH